jgi:hypothetical protein
MAEVHLSLEAVEPTAYRALSLSKSGLILKSTPLMARDDDEALSLAIAMVRGAGIELWDGLRFMVHFGPEPRPATGA